MDNFEISIARFWQVSVSDTDADPDPAKRNGCIRIRIRKIIRNQSKKNLPDQGLFWVHINSGSCVQDAYTPLQTVFMFTKY